MKNYLRTLASKRNFVFDAIIPIILFIGMVIFNQSNIILEIQKMTNYNILQYPFITIIATLVLTLTIAVIRRLRSGEINISDRIITNCLIFFSLTALYLFLINSLLLYGTLALVILLVIALSVRMNSLKEYQQFLEEDELVRGNGNIINYYHLLFKDSKFVSSLFLIFALSFLIALNGYTRVATSVEQPFADNVMLQRTLIIVCGVLLIHLGLFIINFRKKYISTFDTINFTILITTLITAYTNIILFAPTQEYLVIYIIIWSIIFVFSLILSIIRSIKVSKKKIIQNDQLVFEKKGLRVYSKQLILNSNLILLTLIAVLGFLLSVFLKVYSNSQAITDIISFQEATTYFLCGLLGLFLLTGFIVILQGINSKKITLSDDVLYVYHVTHLLMVFHIITDYTTNNLLIWSIIELVLALLLLKRILTVKIEKIVDAAEVIKTTIIEQEQILEEEIETPAPLDEDESSLEVVLEEEIIENHEEEVQNVETEEETEIIPESEDNVEESAFIIELIDDQELLIDKFEDLITHFQKIHLKSKINLPKLTTKTEKLLCSVLYNFNNTNELDTFWKKYHLLASSYNQLHLNPYETFALLFIKDRNIQAFTKLKNAKQYLVVNSEDFLSEFRIYNRTNYLQIRNNALEPIFKECDVNIATIIVNLFIEAKYYYLKHINKKKFKLETGSIDSLEYFDLFFLEIDHDLAKSRRQITKFLDLYEQSNNGEASICYKNFVDSIKTNQYASTMLYFFSDEAKSIKHKEKLYIDIVKRGKYYHTTQLLKVNGEITFAGIIRDICLSSKRRSSHYIDLLFENCNDIVLLNDILNRFEEKLGQKHQLTQRVEGALRNLIDNSLARKNNLLEKKDYSHESLKIINKFLGNEKFSEIVTPNVNEQTVTVFIGTYIYQDKIENGYHYYLNKQAFTIIPKPVILKLVKTKDKSVRKELLIKLIKTSIVETKLNINFANF